MPTIDGGNNPHSSAFVGEDGRLETRAVTLTDQQQAAGRGAAFNINTGQVTLTDDVETPIFYVRNDGEKPLRFSRIFLTVLSSSGGSGPVAAYVRFNVTAGTILDAPVLPVRNFNAASARDIGATVLRGGDGVTFEHDDGPPVEFLFPSDGFRSLTEFDHIVVPRGGSILFTVKPPTGNTAVAILAGTNAFTSQGADL